MSQGEEQLHAIIQASTDHDAGQQLLGMGGAIALLRWKLDH